MDFSVKVEGLDKIQNATREVQKAVEAELVKGLFASAKKVEAEAKRSITSGEKTGRTYKRRSVTHQASAPGEAPASDTGRLVNSIGSYVFRDKLEAVVLSRLKYARMLEFGTRGVIGNTVTFHDDKAYESGEIQRGLLARPFMFPALEKSKAWIRERLAKAVRTAAAKSVKR